MIEKTMPLSTKAGLLAGLALATSLSLCTGFYSETYAAPAKVAQKFQLRASKTDTKKETTQKTTDKRKEIVEEAVLSLRETQDALKHLDSGKNKEALAALERATGKLEIVLARDPKVALVPVDVKASTSDVYGSLEAIKKARQEAEKFLKEGRLQEARRILQNFGSETVISTANLPLATYPAALKKAAKLIDENKTNEAKEALQTALNTLVVTDMIVPLPVLRAQVSLEKADDIAKMKTRSADNNKKLTELIDTADQEIKVAEALGYGKKEDFDSFHKQIDSIRQKTANGKSGIGFFEQIKAYMNSMANNSQRKSQTK